MGVDDMARAIRFWSGALDYEPRGGEVEDDWTVLVPKAGGPGTHVALALSESPVEERPRLHLDLYPGDGDDQANRSRAARCSRSAESRLGPLSGET